MNPVKIKVTHVVEVQSAPITAVNATLEDGQVIPVTGPVTVGDEAIKTADGNISIMSAADFMVAKVV